MVEQDIETQIRLPWPTICGLAVKALVMGVSFNDVCEFAVAQRVWGWE